MVPQFVPLCTLTSLTLSVLSVGPVGADNLQATCSAIPKDQAAWTYFWDGSCYTAHGSEIDATMSYFEAQQSCTDIPGLEGHLAVFPDNFASLFPMMPYVFPTGDDFTLFLGLEQQKINEADEPSKNWFWVFPDGSRNTLPPGFWSPGQPDDPDGTLNYGAFIRRGSQFGLGNVGSSPTNGYVCQYDPVLTTGRIPSGGTPPPVTDTTPTTSTTPKTKPTTSPTTASKSTTATTSPTRVGESAVNVTTTTAMPATIKVAAPATGNATEVVHYSSEKAAQIAATTTAMPATNVDKNAAAAGTENETEVAHNSLEKAAQVATTTAKKGENAKYSSILIVLAAITATRIGDVV